MLQDIADISEACSNIPDTSGGLARKMENGDEFQELVERLRAKKAIWCCASYLYSGEMVLNLHGAV